LYQIVVLEKKTVIKKKRIFTYFIYNYIIKIILSSFNNNKALINIFLWLQTKETKGMIKAEVSAETDNKLPKV